MRKLDTGVVPHAQQPAEVEVRRAYLADAEPVGGLTERVYRQGGWTDEDYSRLLLDGRSRIEEAIVLVATAAGAVIGTVTMALPGSRLANVGRGVAGLLMDACEALARNEGCAAVVLSTEPDMYAAHRLYGRRGYVRQPGRDWQAGRFRLMVFRLQL